MYKKTYSLKRWLSCFVMFIGFAISVNAQYAIKHYIAPAPWQYSSDANEFIVSTLSTTAVSVVVTKSDGTAITTLSVIAGTPVAFRPSGAPGALAANAVNTIYTDRGLVFTSATPVAVSIRNVESDAVNGGNFQFIKGNAALSSYGNEAAGRSFRVGYYRKDFTGLGNVGGASVSAPVYSVMAISNSTNVLKNGVALVTLNAGESYLFQTPIGDLITSDKSVVMNSGNWGDLPGGCTDAVFDEIPPVRVLGKNYLVLRGNGNATTTATNFPEQSTIVASLAGTTVTVTNYNAAGTQISTSSFVLTNAGDSQLHFYRIE